MKNPQYTIQQLRQNGYKVRVIHRDWDKGDTEFVNVMRLAEDVNPSVTQIDVTTPDRKHTVTGYAFRAEGDQYNRKLGNLIALNRAMMELQKVL